MGISLAGILGGGVPELVGKVLDKIFPDPAEREKAALALKSQDGQQALQEMQTQLSAIIAEANSSDPWTSRARPAFMYVIYIYMLAALPMGIVFAFAPSSGHLIAAGVQAWLAAIPEDVWWLFGAGYLGYVGARSFDKAKGRA